MKVGDRLGHYAVTALIGEGGMGQVDRATDSELGRDVALKVLPDTFASDPERLDRFQREAQLLASLNHPSIAAIYGLEDGPATDPGQPHVRALVLELVEGPTLAERIAVGPIPIDEALPIATQIAEALEAAHQAGVIHRDLKPANIKVRDDGTVKVLDFGLAKAVAGVDTDALEAPTIAGATQVGAVVGTPAYMSPEQAKAQLLDQRTDVWSFGVVLFEMLTGRPVFVGDAMSQVLAEVLKTSPDFSLLPAGTPSSVRRLLRRCLDKDKKRRLPDIGVARLEIADAVSGLDALDVGETPTGEAATASSTPSGRPAPSRVWVTVLALLVLVSAVADVAAWRLSRRPEPAPAWFSIGTSQSDPLFIADVSADLALSRDGRHLAYLAEQDGQRRVQLQSLDSLTATTIVAEGSPFSPFFSPDGEWVGYYDSSGPVLSGVTMASSCSRPPSRTAACGACRRTAANRPGSRRRTPSVGSSTIDFRGCCRAKTPCSLPSSGGRRASRRSRC